MWGRIGVVMLVVLIVAACGGDTGEQTDTGTDTDTDTTTAQAEDTADDMADEPEDEPSDDEEPSDEGGGIEPGGMVVEPGDATVTVDGESLPPSGLLRCIPFSDQEGNLDLQILGDGYQLFVYVSGLSHELSMQGRAIGDGETLGVYGNSATSFDGTTYTDDETGEELEAAPFEYTGDRVSGSMVLHDARGSGDSIEVTFDAPVPADVNDCSL